MKAKESNCNQDYAVFVQVNCNSTIAYHSFAWNVRCSGQ